MAAGVVGQRVVTSSGSVRSENLLEAKCAGCAKAFRCQRPVLRNSGRISVNVRDCCEFLVAQALDGPDRRPGKRRSDFFLPDAVFPHQISMTGYFLFGTTTTMAVKLPGRACAM